MGQWNFSHCHAGRWYQGYSLGNVVFLFISWLFLHLNPPLVLWIFYVLYFVHEYYMVGVKVVSLRLAFAMHPYLKFRSVFHVSTSHISNGILNNYLNRNLERIEWDTYRESSYRKSATDPGL